ncbi:hypothetical protein HX005_18835 [Acinetobacter sp. R933-2]|uniref:hypothetical protein n=1 Tax=Acinetobacter sp. R933-2 TaxID=2746728 RepID=UPI0025754641|nr:hypothetical protein [Acinetobacter sp. R933-2]MDM1249419.1 hypothetical protein [Acinetobacter sp. R933-2]
MAAYFLKHLPDSLGMIDSPYNMIEKTAEKVDDPAQQDKPTKKSLFSRLVREILK